MDCLSPQILSADSKTTEEEYSSLPIFGKTRENYTEWKKKKVKF